MGLGLPGLAFCRCRKSPRLAIPPLFVVVFAAMFLNEKVGVGRLSMVALGMIGVLIVLSPRLSLGTEMSTRETLGAVVVLMGAMFAAPARVFVRKLVQTEDTAAIAFWFSITSTFVGLLTLLGAGYGPLGCRDDVDLAGCSVGSGKS